MAASPTDNLQVALTYMQTAQPRIALLIQDAAGQCADAVDRVVSMYESLTSDVATLSTARGTTNMPYLNAVSRIEEIEVAFAEATNCIMLAGVPSPDTDGGGSSDVDTDTPLPPPPPPPSRAGLWALAAGAIGLGAYFIWKSRR